jgi:hypothetical protein
VRLLVIATVTLTTALGVAGCSSDDDGGPSTRPPEAFCRAAERYEDRLVRGAGVDEQVRLVRRLVETAPADIEADTQTFLDALEAVQADPDNPDLRDDPDVEEAVENVNRYATNGCELLEDEDGGGSPF